MSKFKVGEKVQMKNSPGAAGVIEAVGLKVAVREVVKGHGFTKIHEGAGVSVRWERNPYPQVVHENDLAVWTPPPPAKPVNPTAEEAAAITAAFYAAGKIHTSRNHRP